MRRNARRRARTPPPLKSAAVFTSRLDAIGFIRSRPFVCAFFVCALLAISQAAHAQSPFNAELNDVWATPGENNWGLQLVEQGDLAFGTLFVNDAAGRPTFYWAFLAPGPGQTWSGDLI